MNGTYEDYECKQCTQLKHSRARKTLKVSTNEDAVTKALQESLLNREIHASLKDLIRKGRGRFVDVYD